MRIAVFMLLLAVAIGCNSCSRELASSTPLVPSNPDSFVVPTSQDEPIVCTISIHNITHYLMLDWMSYSGGNSHRTIDTVFRSWQYNQTQLTGRLHNDTLIAHTCTDTIRLVLSTDWSEVKELSISRSVYPDWDNDPRDPDISSVLSFVATGLPLCGQTEVQRLYMIKGQTILSHIAKFFMWDKYVEIFGHGGQYYDDRESSLLSPLGSEADSYISITLALSRQKGWQTGATRLKNYDPR